MATQSNPELQAKLEEIKSLPVMRLRTIKWRWILLIMFGEWLGLSLFVTLGQATAPVVVFMALFGGWQLGCTSERNDWHKQVSDLASTNSEPTRTHTKSAQSDPKRKANT